MPATGHVESVKEISVESAVGLVCKCIGHTITSHEYINVAEELIKYQEWKIKCRELEDLADDDERHDWGCYAEPYTSLKWLERVMEKLLEVADEQTILAALKVRADDYANMTLQEVEQEANWAIATAIENFESLTDRLPDEKREEIQQSFREALLQQAHEIC